MTSVSLHLDGSPADGPVVTPPRRYRLSSAALDELARRAGLGLPWQAAAGPSSLARALGGVSAPPPPSAHEPTVELTRLGLLSTRGRPDAGLVAALAVFAAPEVFVEVDLGVRRRELPAGISRLRAWHRCRDGSVTALATAGGSAELAWWSEQRWPLELSRVVTPTSFPPGPLEPAAYLRLPYELLLGSAAALREQRPAVLAELLDRHHGRVSDRDGTAYSRTAAEDQLRRLHATERGRLLVTVAGERRRLGIVSWVLFADGWRELVPAPAAGEPMVVVRSVAPGQLGGTVARLVAGARS